jgi:hypothetical protein
MKCSGGIDFSLWSCTTRNDRAMRLTIVASTTQTLWIHHYAVQGIWNASTDCSRTWGNHLHLIQVTYIIQSTQNINITMLSFVKFWKKLFYMSIQVSSFVFLFHIIRFGPPLWSSGQSSWLQIQRSRFDCQRYQVFWEIVGLERGPFSLVSKTEGLLERKSSSFGLENRDYGCRGSTALTMWHSSRSA